MGISGAQDEWSRGRGQPGRLMPQRCPLSGVVSATRTFATSAIVNCAASPHANPANVTVNSMDSERGVVKPRIVQWASFAKHISRSRISGCQKRCLHPAFLVGMGMSDVRENPESAYDVWKGWSGSVQPLITENVASFQEFGRCGLMALGVSTWPACSPIQ